MRARPAARALGWLLLAALVAAPALAEKVYKKDRPVSLSGRVTDAEGRPLAGVTVLLEASRESFRLLRLRSERGETLTLTAATDADGRYRFDWRWDPYYNRFALAVALPVTRGGETGFEVFERRDVSSEVFHRPPPLDIPLVVAEPGYLRWLQRHLDGRASADERRVYRELGRPDRIDRAERRDGPETSWWYFAAGKVYRFREGTLDGVVHFDPVPPAGTAEDG